MPQDQVEQELATLRQRIDSLTADVANAAVAGEDIAHELRQVSASLEDIRRACAGRRDDAGKDSWLAVLAHELRNPLTPIRNALHVLRLRGGDEKTRTWAGDLLDRQVRRLAGLIDDLLDVSRIARGKVQLQREHLDLADLVRTTADGHRHSFDEAGLTLEVSVPAGPVPVVGDATRLAQSLGHLLDNSLKFTTAGGTVAVRLDVDGPAGQAIVSVQDSGAGIDPRLLPDVFNSFAQDDRNATRGRAGLGLGLALVKGLIELHGGSVAASSAGPGKGALFTVRVPVQPAAVTESPSPEPAAQPLRLLVIEDNYDAAENLKHVLESMGHEVRVVYSGPSGVETARLFQPDAVLCDLGLPGLDGFEVARRLRGDPATADVRVIALSGPATPEQSARCHEAGFDASLPKPVDPQQLQRTLAKHSQGSVGRAQ